MESYGRKVEVIKTIKICNDFPPTRLKYYTVFVDHNILCEQNVGLIMFFLKAQEIRLPNMKHIIQCINKNFLKNNFENSFSIDKNGVKSCKIFI